MLVTEANYSAKDFARGWPKNEGRKNRFQRCGIVGVGYAVCFVMEDVTFAKKPFQFSYQSLHDYPTSLGFLLPSPPRPESRKKPTIGNTKHEYISYHYSRKCYFLRR